MTLEECFGFLPDPPTYVAGDDGWLPLETVRTIPQLSDTGFEKLRRRFNKRYEHRDRNGRVFFYGPYWLRAWAVDGAIRRVGEGKPFTLNFMPSKEDAQ